MAFTINRNLVFIGSVQFMNSSLDSLDENLYPYEYVDSFKKFSEDKLSDRCKFFSSLKDECISEKDYLKASNIWNVFKMNLFIYLFIYSLFI